MPEPDRIGRVLVIDDEPAIAQAMRWALRGYELHAASSVAAAEALLAHDQDFDLILCDVMMPGRLGVELMAWIRANHPSLEARVVYMSGGFTSPSARAFFEGGSFLLLDKPFDAASIRRLVAERVAVRRRGG